LTGPNSSSLCTAYFFGEKNERHAHPLFRHKTFAQQLQWHPIWAENNGALVFWLFCCPTFGKRSSQFQGCQMAHFQTKKSQFG
jgi:hypothetical protein